MDRTLFPVKDGDAFLSCWHSAPDHPYVVFLPGLKGFVNWGAFPHACQTIAENGFNVIGVDYSHCGVVDHQSDITRLDLVRNNSISRQIEEVSALLASIDSKNIVLFGHSLGAAIALLAAAKDNSGKIKGVAAWAAPADFKNVFSIEQRDMWRQNGELNMPNKRTGQDYILGAEYLHDIEHLDVTAAAASLTMPCLFIHGERDDVVKQDNALVLTKSTCNSKVALIAQASHTFNITHPLQALSEQYQSALNQTVLWLQTHSQ